MMAADGGGLPSRSNRVAIISQIFETRGISNLACCMSVNKDIASIQKMNVHY